MCPRPRSARGQAKTLHAGSRCPAVGALGPLNCEACYNFPIAADPKPFRIRASRQRTQILHSSTTCPAKGSMTTCCLRGANYYQPIRAYGVSMGVVRTSESSKVLHPCRRCPSKGSIRIPDTTYVCRAHDCGSIRANCMCDRVRPARKCAQIEECWLGPHGGSERRCAQDRNQETAPRMGLREKGPSDDVFREHEASVTVVVVVSSGVRCWKLGRCLRRCGRQADD
jgi:hypothetical protein